ncbi:Domain often clustered or fused with uracil-DNA glycosylase [Cystobacter fuscus DSM 2262]|uniref:Type-4 uracil-DNA glycosylase n=1 Tax=Cystobacter fuscus (strain ATCC 25194 / DSM 2262 / NBRC 100088 / M29) TaxID=1242864 RepID=S9Q1G3_CYSF2|nr:UdgX family uracil-DNA binding protein [Cystobacter fuscus]EPX55099.1 Domain often clustered or fused with uracil-DNA glycosylase [Cystobacter fuscus DSM 2262]
MRVEVGPDLESFRAAARGLLVRGVPPERVLFTEERDAQASLLAPEAVPASAPVAGLAVPPAFLELAEKVACHRSPERWGLLYRVLWRLTHGERKLLEVESDADVYRLLMLAKAVQRDAHKMKAFVRFRRVEREGEEYFIAWHRPEHLVVRYVAPFFARRFPSMRWSILTPDASVSWDLERLLFGPGVPRSEAPEGDVLEEMWGTYYASTFNPARLNVRAMRAEMPRKHWATLPEARLIPELVRQAPERTARMVGPRLELSESSRFLPEQRDIASLAEAAKGCRACPLHERATQTVFGEGPEDARLMLVGEQPGDTEDREGRPFIGPAGRLLDEVLAGVGLKREELYVTNAVKHFGWMGEEKQRLHAKPGRREMLACKAWLHAEVERVRPRMILCLGATAAQSFLGPGFRINLSRGQVFETPWAKAWMATFHPSALLRMPDERARVRARLHFEEDLRKVADTLRALG